MLVSVCEASQSPLYRGPAPVCGALRQLDVVLRRRGGRGSGRCRRHQPGEQAVGQFRRQRQAPLIDQRHVIAMSALARACRRLHRARSPQRTLAIEARQRPVGGDRAGGNRCFHGGFRGSLLGGGRCRGLTRRQRFVLRHLAHQHVRQTNTAAFAGHGNGQLLVVHFLVLLGCRRVERIVLAQRVGGRAHGLEHFTEEQRFEFLRHLAHVARRCSCRRP